MYFSVQNLTMLDRGVLVHSDRSKRAQNILDVVEYPLALGCRCKAICVRKSQGGTTPAGPTRASDLDLLFFAQRSSL